MTDDMLRRLMRRLHRRYAARQVAAWKRNVEAASRKWDKQVTSVPLSVWWQTSVWKGMVQ